MTYRIFVSHTKADSEVAQAITNVLNNAFEGNVHLYLASREVIGGEEWKKELKKELKERDAIICVITPESVRSPWLFIEWSAFWIADKRFYLLINDEIRVSDLVQPMQDRQMTLVQQKSSVINLFKALARDAGIERIPYEYVDEFVGKVNEAFERQVTQRFEKYRHSSTALPPSDDEKRKIALHFYQREEYDVFLRVASEIRDDAIKSDIILSLIRHGDVERAVTIAHLVKAADRLGAIAIELINRGYEDWKELRALVEDIALKNQAELRKTLLSANRRG